jgi:glycogen operon protein
VSDPSARNGGDPLGGLGVTPRDGGVDAAVFSSVAERVELCLFDGDRESRLELDGDHDGVWRGRVEGVGHGQHYGLRVHGPYDPSRGRWCDPTKLLVDPYTRALAGGFHRDAALHRIGVDSAAFMPRCVVVDDGQLGGFRVSPPRPQRPWDDTVLYEVHVRGATLLHPGVPTELRGTYLGLAHGAFLEHLVRLGVSTVELLPVFEWMDEPALSALGLTNYWGYNPICFFVPTARFATARGADPLGTLFEFRAMVDALHGVGIEVILDVVYNHTAEGGHDGDTVSLKGLDAATYYRLDHDGAFVDTTGCGTSLNAEHPVAVRLVLDSLRYWASCFGVDGFRFDLAPTLARVGGKFDPGAPILQGCANDPVLRERKLIAEAWDVGCDDSLAQGRFDDPIREWNGEFRDHVREFWRGDPDTIGSLATRLAGSHDLFAARSVTASVNYVTCHDGLTLHDLVTYDVKHNEANGEQNRDGADDNRSWNCGVEGETDDAGVTALRATQVRALLATVLLSRGVPMMLGGDELGRTQQGNNNPYCQDNPTSWFDWEHADDALCDVVRRLVALRRAHRRLLADEQVQPRWCSPLGTEVLDGAWGGRAVSMLLGDELDALVVLVNGEAGVLEFVVPAELGKLVIAYSSGDDAIANATIGADRRVGVHARSVCVLERPQVAGGR